MLRHPPRRRCRYAEYTLVLLAKARDAHPRGRRIRFPNCSGLVVSRGVVLMYIFQYGSNVDESRLNSQSRLGESARPMGLASTIERFDLRFNVHSRRQNCGVANLVPGDRIIYGALYDIPDDRVYRDKKINGLNTLDEIEGEGSSYHRKPITVCCDGEEYAATTYLASSDDAEKKNDAGLRQPHHERPPGHRGATRVHRLRRALHRA